MERASKKVNEMKYDKSDASKEENQKKEATTKDEL